jgi:hypothetical protein
MNGLDIIFSDNLAAEKVADALIMYCVNSDNTERDKIKECRRLYNNERNESEFDHITRPHVKNVEDACGNITTETNVMPAKIRHVPLVKTYIRALLSEENDRPLLLNAYTTDAENAMERENAILKNINEIETSRHLNKIAAIQLRQQAIGVQKQMLEQGQQAPQEGEQPSDPRAQQQANMQIMAHLETLNKLIDEDANVTGKEFEAVKKYFYTDYKMPCEQFGELVCQFTIEEQRSRTMLKRAFEDRLVTGHEIYHVDWMPGMTDPLHRRVIAENVYFPDNEHVDYLHQHQWAVEENFMTYDNLISEFGMYITPQIREKIKQEMQSGGSGNLTTQNTSFTPDGRFVGTGSNNNSSGGGGMTNLSVIVHRVYWKKDERINVLIRKKKNRPDFYTVLSDDQADKMLSNPKLMKSRNERIEPRYIQRLNSAVRVGKSTYLFAGEHPVQLREESDKTSLPLPYIGHAKTPYYQPESLVWQTKDLQEMYDLLNYQLELLWALAGVRGSVYDMSQKPKDMDIEDVIYYRRQGFLMIESVDENGKAKQFNQFQSYDDTVSPSIQYVEASLQRLQANIAFITGITDARIGIIKPTDQVGTAQLSYNSSSLITESFFQEHEELTELLFGRIVNLAKIAYEEGIDRGNIIAGPNLMKRIMIPKGVLKGDFKIRMKSGRKEAKIMEDYKGAAKAMFARGAMPASLYVETLSTNSFVALRQLIKSHEELQSKLQQAGVENEQQHQMQIEQMKAEINLKTAMTLEQVKGEQAQAMKQVDVQLEAQKLKIQSDKVASESALWQQDIEVKERMGKYAVDKDYDIEMKYLVEQQKERQVQNKNNQIAMMLNTISTELKLGHAKEKVRD